MLLKPELQHQKQVLKKLQNLYFLPKGKCHLIILKQIKVIYLGLLLMEVFRNVMATNHIQSIKI